MTTPSGSEPTPYDPQQQPPPPGDPWAAQVPPPGYGPPPGYVPPPGYGPPYGYPVPGAPYGVDPMTGVPLSDKSKVIAGVLQLVLGAVGAGRWYTGHYGIAVAQLLTCGGLGIWALIDGIMMLVGNVKDPQGRPLRG
ncbi:MAG TPA: TM2 domain-containing protein [Mycobacteriales bacterium]|nr:TM2 domain-containing protein [Mycobacteriales bacterium]